MRGMVSVSPVLVMMIAAGAVCGFAQTGPQARAEQRVRAAELKNLLADARSAPAEFRADALLRIAESNLPVGIGLKEELIEEAFRAAAEVQHPVRRRQVEGIVDTRAGYLSYAFDLELDALSIRSRAVAAMLAVNKRKARELFGEIPPKLPLEQLGCEDALIYDVSVFYQTLGRVAGETFGAEERELGSHCYFVQPYVEQIASPAQVGPAAALIIALRPTPPQLVTLIRAFVGALKRIGGDDRSFSYSMLKSRSTLSGLLELVKACPDQSPELKRDLLEGIRSYMLNSLKGARCDDNLDAADFVATANKALGFESPISEEEARPEKVLGLPENPEYWRTPRARRLLSRARRLRFGSLSRTLWTNEKLSPEWQAQMSEFLNELADWDNREEESESAYFHQKGVLLEALVELALEGHAKDKALADYVYFLRDSAVQRDNRIEWLWHVKALVTRVPKLFGNDAPKVLNLLIESKNANLRLYANLTKLEAAGRRPANRSDTTK